MKTRLKGVWKRFKDSFKKRLKNPVFRLALIGFLYKLYTTYGVTKLGFPAIPEQDFRTALDTVAYILIGSGIFTSIKTPEEKEAIAQYQAEGGDIDEDSNPVH